MKGWKKILIVLVLFISMTEQSFAQRIKDIAQVAGVRDNQLIGYGLVVGLNGTGDKNPFTDQSLTSMLNKFGINMPAGVKPNSKNIAAVSVTANLPAFVKPGQKIDVAVASLGNAKSLGGGVLLMTPLKGLDGKIYAVAQGSVIVTGVGASGKDGSSVTTNFPAGGHLPNGAIVEQSVDMGFDVGSTIVLNLRNGDFNNVQRVVDVINNKIGEDTARALDDRSVEVIAPRMAHQKVAFLAQLENLQIDVVAPAARIVVNSRSGSVVVGGDVVIKPAAVSHGKLTVVVDENQTMTSGKSEITVKETNKKVFVMGTPMPSEGAPKISDLVKQANMMGLSPTDLVGILESLKEAGALDAELVVI